MVTEVPTLPKLFVKEIFQPLFIAIIATVIIWIAELYLVMCVVVFVSSVIGISINLYDTYLTNKKIYEMAYYEVELDALREGRIQRISSREAVPGDIVFFKHEIKVPFDCVLLEGACLVN